MTATAAPSPYEVSAAGMAERSGFLELTEYHPGENGHGEATWVSVRHVLRVKTMREFASDHVYTMKVFVTDVGLRYEPIKAEGCPICGAGWRDECDSAMHAAEARVALRTVREWQP